MKKLHFIGIKGTGMSALAHILHDLGLHVQGSDVEKTFFTQKKLEERHIPMLPFGQQNITEEMTVIAGNAFPDSHEEIQAAKEKGLPVYRYHDFLGNLIQSYTSIAVSGAHGKTSTTGLMSHVFSNIFPTSYLIGDGTGVGTKDSDYFVFEACEYKRHFLAYQPDYAIITNIDFDHPDYFTGIDDVKNAFESFMKQTKKQVIACGDDPHIQLFAKYHQIFTYGLGEDNDLRADHIHTNEKGTLFTLIKQEQTLGEFFIPAFGTHQVLNALAVLAVCILEAVDLKEAKKHFATYGGVKRRFNEELFNGNVLIDDYAHHPTEIKATIESVRAKYPTKECIVIFQPHTYSRTKEFLREFAASLARADKVYLCDIFGSAREQDGSVSIYDLINLTPKSNHLSLETMSQLHAYEDKVLLFMGAGDIERYIEAYKRRVLQAN